MKRTTVGSNVQYPPFPKTVMTAHAWSVLEEIIRYLKNMEIDNKKCVLQGHLHAMARTVGKRIYSQQLIVRVFSILQHPGACTIDSESIINHGTSKH